MGEAVAAWSPTDLATLEAWYDPAQAYCSTDAALDCEASSTQFLSHAGNADLRGGSTWYRAGWIKLESTGVVHTIMTTLSGNDGYEVRVTSGNVLEVEVGTGSATNTATHATSLSAGTWYFWEAQYDGADVGIALNGGSFTTTTTGFSAGSSAFRIGSTIAGGSYLDGLAQHFVAFDGNPTSGNRTSLYNSGSGVSYSGRPSGPAYVSWWQLPESSGARVDSHGSNDLTAVNTPGVGVGLVEQIVQDRSPVKRWEDRSGNGNHLTQSDITKQPVWNEDQQNGEPGLEFDGINDVLTRTAWPFTGDQEYSVLHTSITPFASGLYIMVFCGTGSTNQGTGVGLGTSKGYGLFQWGGTEFYKPAPRTSTWAYLACRRSTSRINVRENGSDAGSSGTPAALNLAASPTLYVGEFSSFEFVGHVGELIICSSDLSDGDVESGEAYLADRWGI